MFDFCRYTTSGVISSMTFIDSRIYIFTKKFFDYRIFRTFFDSKVYPITENSMGMSGCNTEAVISPFMENRKTYSRPTSERVSLLVVAIR